MNPAKYFEACHRIIMTNIFLAKQVPPWAWLGWCLVTRQERAGLATVKLRARDQAPHLPSLYTPEPVPCPPRVGAGRWHSQAGAGGQ